MCVVHSSADADAHALENLRATRARYSISPPARWPYSIIQLGQDRTDGASDEDKELSLVHSAVPYLRPAANSNSMPKRRCLDLGTLVRGVS